MRETFPDVDIESATVGGLVKYTANGPEDRCEAWFSQLCETYPPEGYETKNIGFGRITHTRWVMTVTRKVQHVLHGN